jgi:hypothetical protein
MKGQIMPPNPLPNPPKLVIIARPTIITTIDMMPATRDLVLPDLILIILPLQ